MCTCQSREMCYLMGLVKAAGQACAVLDMALCCGVSLRSGGWGRVHRRLFWLGFVMLHSLLQVHARRRKLDPDVDLLQIAKDLPGLSGELLQPLPALHPPGRAAAEPEWYCSLHHVTP